MHDTQFEDEIDFREIIGVILARWRWIAAATILAAVAALGVSLLLPKQYQASAYVALTKPDVVFRFDPRITTEVEMPSGKGILDLALSDDVLQNVLESEKAADLDPEERIVDVFREKVDSSLSGTVIKLTIKDTGPEQIASLANVWAEAVSNQINNIYAPSSRTQDIFEAQAEDALIKWTDAQKALTKFQGTNPESILECQLNAKRSAFGAYLETRHSLEMVLLDAQALLVRLETRGSGANTNLRDDILTLLLATRSLSSTTPSTSSYDESLTGTFYSNKVHTSPIEMQILAQGNTLLNESAEEQVQYLAELVESIESQKVILEEAAEKLEGEIYILQGQYTEAVEERTRLERGRDLAYEAYEALARKTKETRIVTQDQETVALVASRAAAPSQKIGPQIKLNTLLGGFLGLLLGIFWAFFDNWLNEEKRNSGENK